MALSSKNSKNCHSPTPMTLEGSTAVRQAWYHLGRHRGDTLELILAGGGSEWGVPRPDQPLILVTGRGEGRSAQTLP